jgi:periplasmic protein TonB
VTAPPESLRWSRRHERIGFACSWLVALSFHAAIVLGLPYLQVSRPLASAKGVELFEVALLEPEPEPQAPPPTEPEPVATQSAAPRAAASAHREIRAPPPKSMPSSTVPASPESVVSSDIADFSNTIMTSPGRGGSGVSGAPGIRGGGDEGAMARPAAPSAAAGGGGGNDRSRVASLQGGRDWNCQFPAEADDAAIDFAVVTLRISVDPDGHASEISLVQDPGHGFGPAARNCASQRAYLPALNAGGHPTRASITVRVRFVR